MLLCCYHFSLFIFFFWHIYCFNGTKNIISKYKALSYFFFNLTSLPPNLNVTYRVIHYCSLYEKLCSLTSAQNLESKFRPNFIGQYFIVNLVNFILCWSLNVQLLNILSNIVWPFLHSTALLIELLLSEVNRKKYVGHWTALTYYSSQLMNLYVF